VACFNLCAQDTGLLYPIPIKLLNKPEAYNSDNLPVSAATWGAEATYFPPAWCLRSSRFQHQLVLPAMLTYIYACCLLSARAVPIMHATAVGVALGPLHWPFTSPALPCCSSVALCRRCCSCHCACHCPCYCRCLCSCCCPCVGPVSVLPLYMP
jgi:hypothetical protein